MPRLKVGDDELNIDELENAEYNEDGDFEDYTGPKPPKKTILRGFVKLAYWTLDSSDERMIKSLFIAAENTGDKAKYNGCPIWDNTSIKPSTKFRWAPLIRSWGITLIDIKKKLYCKPEEEDHPTRGAVIEKIGTWKPGEEEDTAYCMVLTDLDKEYEGERAVKVGKWLPWEDPEQVDDEADEADEDGAEPDEDEVEPDEDDTEDEPEDDDQEDEPEEEEAEEPPARTGRRAAKPAAATGKPATRSTATRSTRPATTARTAKAATGKPAAATARSTKPATAGRRGSPARGDSQPPPF